LLKEHGVDVSGLASEAEHLRQQGATAVFVAMDAKATGVLAVADQVIK